jgi:hypothetical protein
MKLPKKLTSNHRLIEVELEAVRVGAKLFLVFVPAFFALFHKSDLSWMKRTQKTAKIANREKR